MTVTWEPQRKVQDARSSEPSLGVGSLDSHNHLVKERLLLLRFASEEMRGSKTGPRMYQGGWQWSRWAR